MSGDRSRVTRTVTATPVLTVNEATTEEVEQRTIYRCDECKALILSEDHPGHLAWHSALLHHHVPNGGA